MAELKILIAEDESVVAMDIQEALRDASYSVLGVADTGTEAVQRAAASRPDLVLMDIRLKGGMDGVEAAGLIRQGLGIPVVYLTAHSDQGTLRRANLTEPYGYVVKPFEREALHAAIEMAIHKHQTEKAFGRKEPGAA